jgi:hypothetical protein
MMNYLINIIEKEYTEEERRLTYKIIQDFLVNVCENVKEFLKR